MHSSKAPKAWFYPRPLCGAGSLEWILIGLGALIAYLLGSPSGGWP